MFRYFISYIPPYSGDVSLDIQKNKATTMKMADKNAILNVR